MPSGSSERGGPAKPCVQAGPGVPIPVWLQDRVQQFRRGVGGAHLSPQKGSGPAARRPSAAPPGRKQLAG